MTSPKASRRWYMVCPIPSLHPSLSIFPPPFLPLSRPLLHSAKPSSHFTDQATVSPIFLPGLGLHSYRRVTESLHPPPTLPPVTSVSLHHQSAASSKTEGELPRRRATTEAPVVVELLWLCRWSAGYCAPTLPPAWLVGAVRNTCRPARFAVKLDETACLFIGSFDDRCLLVWWQNAGFLMSPLRFSQGLWIIHIGSVCHNC